MVLNGRQGLQAMYQGGMVLFILWSVSVPNNVDLPWDVQALIDVSVDWSDYNP